MKLNQWFAAEESALKTWAEKEVNVITTYLGAFFHDIQPSVEKDLLTILKNGLPLVIAALGTNPVGNLGIALATAEAYIVSALKAEGIVLFQTTINVLANGLAAQAQTVVPAPVVAPAIAPVIVPIAQVETTIPSGA